MKIKYFSWLKTITNKDSEDIFDNKIIDLESLKEYLYKKYPKLKNHIVDDQVIQSAINLTHTSENVKISNKDEIALFPPVSGG